MIEARCLSFSAHVAKQAFSERFQNASHTDIPQATCHILVTPDTTAWAYALLQLVKCLRPGKAGQIGNDMVRFTI